MSGCPSGPVGIAPVGVRTALTTAANCGRLGTVSFVQPDRRDPQLAQVLLMASVQVQVLREMLAALACQGVPPTRLVGLHAELDQVQAAVARAQQH